MQRAHHGLVLLLALTALAACCSAAQDGAERVPTNELSYVSQHLSACALGAELAREPAYVHPRCAMTCWRVGVTGNALCSCGKLYRARHSSCTRVPVHVHLPKFNSIRSAHPAPPF